MAKYHFSGTLSDKQRLCSSYKLNPQRQLGRLATAPCATSCKECLFNQPGNQDNVRRLGCAVSSYTNMGTKKSFE